MTPKFDANNEAIKDLPKELGKALVVYARSGSENDLSEVIRLVLKDLGADLTGIELSNNTNFIRDVGLDSLAISEFVFFFEDFFQIKISNEELVTMNTLGELKTFLSGKLG